MQSLPHIDRPTRPSTSTGPPEPQSDDDSAHRYAVPDVQEVPPEPRHELPDEIEW